ncbi:MAG: adenosylmethionine--8-amino-7-oxononanoate transaminase [bacterium]|nr:adenosylmethionine--8-amino-7-oxononanoate transaminase [bacterium]
MPAESPESIRSDAREYSLDELLEYHRRHAWQPFTQMKLAPDPLFIERGKGSLLYTTDGRSLIDAIGSWWVNVHGHSNPYINQAIAEQMERVEHVIYAGLSHEPATVLAKRLSASTGDRLPRAFYSDNGSTAVEIGLKMAFQYYANAGATERREFVALGDGYHGDTIGTMSVGARSVFHEMYSPLLFPCHLLPAPRAPFEVFGDDDRALEHLAPVLESLEKLLQERGDKICGLILEPIVQGASAGFNMYPPVLLKRVRELCDAHGVFWISDEVFTGCGRTGKFYASEYADVWPDIVCISKALAGGYLPFAATLATEKVYAGFYSDERRHTLFHGHSMTANPLGCAAALASLDLIEADQKQGFAGVLKIEAAHRAHLKQLLDSPIGKQIRETRCLGSIAAVELDLPANYTADFGWRLMSAAIERGALLRPLGNVVYLTPAYTIQPAELDRAYQVLQACLQELL